ncbi:MAG: hypothetical protein ABFD69_07990 [Candidatus Sumerlaeia bacterium]
MSKTGTQRWIASIIILAIMVIAYVAVRNTNSNSQHAASTDKPISATKSKIYPQKTVAPSIEGVDINTYVAQVVSDVRISRFDVGIRNQDELRKQMLDWETFQYTPVNPSSIPTLVKEIKIELETEADEKMINDLRESFAAYLEAYSGDDPEKIIALFAGDKADYEKEYPDNDEFLSQARAMAIEAMQSNSQDKSELNKMSTLELLKKEMGTLHTLGSSKIPPELKIKKVKLISTIGGISKDKSRAIIAKLSKDDYIPEQWDPRHGLEGKLYLQFRDVFNTPGGVSNSVYAPLSFRESMKIPHDVYYADLYLHQKVENDPANLYVLRFVWDEKATKWRTMHAVWFYNGPRENLLMW